MGHTRCVRFRPFVVIKASNSDSRRNTLKKRPFTAPMSLFIRLRRSIRDVTQDVLSGDTKAIDGRTPTHLAPIKNFGAIEVTPHSCKRDHTLARPAYKRRSGGASARLREASTPNRKPRPIRCANCDQSCAAFSPKTCVSVWSNSSSQIAKW